VGAVGIGPVSGGFGIPNDCASTAFPKEANKRIVKMSVPIFMGESAIAFIPPLESSKH